MRDLNFDSQDVLAYVLHCCADLNYFVNFTKAQCLLYCCYGTVLAVKQIRLTDDVPVAGKYNPVFTQALNAHLDKELCFDACSNPVFSAWLPGDIRQIMVETVSHFGRYSPEALRRWCCRPHSPWDVTAVDAPMNEFEIFRYFSSQVIDFSDSSAAVTVQESAVTPAQS